MLAPGCGYRRGAGRTRRQLVIQVTGPLGITSDTRARALVSEALKPGSGNAAIKTAARVMSAAHPVGARRPDDRVAGFDALSHAVVLLLSCGPLVRQLKGQWRWGNC